MQEPVEKLLDRVCGTVIPEFVAAEAVDLVPGKAKVAIAAGGIAVDAWAGLAGGGRVVLLPVDLEHDSSQPGQQHQEVHALVEVGALPALGSRDRIPVQPHLRQQRKQRVMALA